MSRGRRKGYDPWEDDGGAPRTREIPETIPGLLLWADPAEEYVIKAGAPERVSVWESREGNAYQFLQAAGPAQPEWLAAGILGQPALYGDGARYMIAAAAAVANAWAALDSTVAYVCDLDSTAASRVVCGAVVAGASSNISWPYSNVVPQLRNKRIGAGSVDSGAAFGTATSPAYALVLHTAVTTTTIRLRGVQIASFADAQSPVVDSVAVLAGRQGGGWLEYTIGSIGDLLVYDHVLTAGEIATLEGWITAKYVGI